MKTKNIVVVFLIFLFSSAVAQAQIWEQTNGPYGGSIQSLAVHPSGDLYAGVFDGGLFRSTDNGDSWFYTGFAGQGVDHVFISPLGTIFICVRYFYTDPSGNDRSGSLPYRSVDNGATWQQLNIYISWFHFNCWGIDSSNNLYAAFRDYNNYWDYDILKSTDEGESWVHWTYHMYGQPNDFLFWNSLILMSDGGAGIHRLINNNWVRVWPSYYSGTNCIEVTNSGVLLAGTNSQGIYISTDTTSIDSTMKWQRIFSGGIEETCVTSLIVNPEGFVFAGTSKGIYRSTDEGSTWTHYGLPDTGIKSLVLKDTTTLFAGDDFGIYRSLVPGEEWESVNEGLYVGRTFSLAINQSTHTFFAATNVGLFRSPNAGIEWEAILPWYSQYEVYFQEIVGIPLLVDNQLNLFCVKGDYDTLYRSSDDGETWVTSGLPPSEIRSFEGGFEPGVIFAGGFSYVPGTHSMVLLSTDTGLTWSETSFQGSGPVQCMAMSSQTYNLFAGAVGGGIYRSTDQGLNWRSLSIGLTNREIYSIVINSAGNIFLGSNNGVFRSRDEGGNWKCVGLENDTVLALAVNSFGYILAGTKAGYMYRSTDEGDTWFDFSSGLNLTTIRSLIIDEQDFAMVGTISDGVFRTIHSTVYVGEDKNEIPTEFLLSQNYPNPFNPSTKIKYSIPSSSQVTIKVFDVLGNEIETLVNEEKQTGTYVLTWNAENLPSGVYFYQLRTGSFVQTRKMLLIK